jgi:hypothetical protein
MFFVSEGKWKMFMTVEMHAFVLQESAHTCRMDRKVCRLFRESSTYVRTLFGTEIDVSVTLPVVSTTHSNGKRLNGNTGGTKSGIDNFTVNT